jgi:hypothetical protein
VAAVVAAVVTARAALLAADATVLWVHSVGEEQRRGALLQESVRYTYGTEAALAFMLLSYEVRADELRAKAAGQQEPVASRLQAEAVREQSVVDLVGDGAPLVSDPRYRKPSGALNVELRLADDRDPGDIAIDPMATLEEGDVAGERSDALLRCTIIIAAAFLFGSLGQAFSRHRRPLLLLGWIALVAGAGAAIAIELGIRTPVG